MKKIILLICAAFALLSSCASVPSSQKLFKTSEDLVLPSDIPEGSGIVYFYRLYHFSGSASPIKIDIKNETAFNMVMNGYTSFLLPVGEYSMNMSILGFNYDTENFSIGNKEIKYYFIDTGFSHVSFKETPEQEALSNLTTCREIPGHKDIRFQIRQYSEPDIAAEPEKDNEKTVKRSISGEIQPIVTVFDFEYEGISEMEAAFLVDYLGGALFDTGNYRIIDRSQREAILSEIQFSMSGCTDESCQLEAGKLLAADYMVIGSLGKVGSRFIINAKLIDIESGETVLSARDIYPDVDAMLDGCDDLAVQLSIVNKNN